LATRYGLSWLPPCFGLTRVGKFSEMDLTVASADGVALLTLNRPERRNTYTGEMGALLNDAYRRCDDDDTVRAIVLTGAGDAFCAGADFSAELSPFGSPSSEFTAAPTDPAAFELRTPVIAAVNGHAIGIGLTLALQADIRIMAEDAKYAVAQVRRGVIPDCMSHWTLPHLVGGAVAADILLTGRTFDGAEAAAMGIASRTMPRGQVLDQAMEVARDIAVNVAPMSAALSKRLLWDTLIKGYTPRQVARLETELHRRVMGRADAREGVDAFLQRRTPRWRMSISKEWEPLPEIRGKPDR
jgi:enoyl-CoA hydratase/carnithine racemase